MIHDQQTFGDTLSGRINKAKFLYFSRLFFVIEYFDNQLESHGGGNKCSDELESHLTMKKKRHADSLSTDTRPSTPPRNNAKEETHQIDSTTREIDRILSSSRPGLFNQEYN